MFTVSLNHFKSIRSGTTKWNIGNEYTNVLNKLTESEKDVLYKYIKESLSTSIFAFLQIFEEHPEFKIIYEERSEQVDLNRISEMLKSEHHGEDGWIQKFSDENKIS